MSMRDVTDVEPVKQQEQGDAMSMRCLEAGMGGQGGGCLKAVVNVPVAVKQTRDFLRCDVTMSGDVCRFCAEAVRCNFDSWPHADVRRCDAIR